MAHSIEGSPARALAGAGGKRTDWRLVALMSLGFGLVSIDRFMISTLMPVMSKDLGLRYHDIGIITGALAFSWGIASLLMGNKADHIGRRKVLIGSMIAFSLLIGASGLATGLVGLVIVRILMGAADGAFVPAAVAATLDSAEPRHHGRAMGFEQMGSSLFGLGLAPLLIAWLLHVVDWRYVFVLFAIPGLLLAFLIWKWVPRAAPSAPLSSNSLADWRLVTGYRNVKLAMALMLCWLTSLVVTSAFLPGYLLDHLHLGFGEMSVVMSAVGIGSAIGALILPGLSDRTGRRPIVLLCSVGSATAIAGLMFAGSQPPLLFALLFMIHFFNSAALALTVGPISADSVPAGLMSTASGLVVCVGEIFGGGLLPIVAGFVITALGISQLLWLPAAAMILAAILCLFLDDERRAVQAPA